MCSSLAYPYEAAKQLDIRVQFVAKLGMLPFEVDMTDTDRPLVILNRWSGRSRAELGALLLSLCDVICQVAQRVLSLSERFVARVPAYCAAA